MNSKNIIGECIKCDGSGYINAFGHINGGKCFLCNGTGKIAGEIKSTVAAGVSDHAVKSAWLSKFDGYTVDEVYGLFKSRLTWEQAWSIHSFADTTTSAWKAARRMMLESLEEAA